MRATARMSALAFLRAVANRLVLASSSAVLSRFLLALVRAVVRVTAVAYLTVDPFAFLFWAFGFRPGNVLSLYSQHFLIWSCIGHANCTAVESWFNSYRRSVPIPLFLYLGMINL